MSKQSVIIRHKYMILPVNMHAKRKRIAFFQGGKAVWEVYTPVDFLTPTYYTYLDVSHLQGQALTIESFPAIDLAFTFADEIPAELGYQGNYRPTVHFTARYGWLNDPNGLVQVNGIYHMFFQYNPTDSDATNIMWGHAVSKDLVHWEQIDSAILPDERGMSFSGSGIIDRQNLSGLGEGQPPVLFYYTAAGGTTMLSEGKRFTQCLAYSKDGGMSVTKYENNPIIDHIVEQNRDPKVVYSPELGCYVMALYLAEDEFALYSSDDLLHFSEFQRLHLVKDNECPNLYPVTVEGEPDAKKWIFGGAHDFYAVGEFEKGKFVFVQEPLPHAHGIEYGASYAAQVFSGVEDGRTIRVSWEWLRSPDPVFEGQLGIPVEVTLCKVGDTYRLRTLPCRELATLKTREDRYAVTSDFAVDLSRSAYDIRLQAKKDCGDFTLRFFGYELQMCLSKNLLIFDKKEIPLSYTGEAEVRILSDVLGCEIFADNGFIATMLPSIADYNIKALSIEGEKNAPLDIALTVCPLQSIHEKKGEVI